MGIARSTFYAAPPVPKDDTAEFYGWRRVQAALRQQGVIVNHEKIKRLMREYGLQPKISRRHVATTDSDHDQPIFPNLAEDTVTDGPDQLWVADISYIAVAAGFVYVAVILDAWSRRVVGYAISRSIDARLTIAALNAARRSRRRAVCTSPFAARNTPLSVIARSSPRAASSARWAGAEIHMTMPRRRAS